jgi:hypothetical protein
VAREKKSADLRWARLAGIICGYEGVMSEVERLKRVLLSLPDLALRVGWLRERIAVSAVSEACQVFNELCEQSERSDPGAREAQFALALAVISLGDHESIDALRRFAQSARLLSLERLLRRGPPPSMIPPDVAVPDYGRGRELTVGERRSLARRPNRQSLEKLLGDPHPLVIRQLLQNPKLTENDVVRLVAKRPLRPALLEELAQAPNWLCRRRVRMSVLLHPSSPTQLAMPLLGVCTRSELREIVGGSDAPVLLRATALELLERRPPLREITEAELVVQ